MWPPATGGGTHRRKGCATGAQASCIPDPPFRSGSVVCYPLQSSICEGQLASPSAWVIPCGDSLCCFVALDAHPTKSCRPEPYTQVLSCQTSALPARYSRDTDVYRVPTTAASNSGQKSGHLNHPLGTPLYPQPSCRSKPERACELHGWGLEPLSSKQVRSWSRKRSSGFTPGLATMATLASRLQREPSTDRASPHEGPVPSARAACSMLAARRLCAHSATERDPARGSPRPCRLRGGAPAAFQAGRR